MITAKSATTTKVTESSLVSIFTAGLQEIEFGSLELQLPNGEILLFKGNNTGPQACLFIKDLEALELILNRGDIGLGEGYIQNLWGTTNVSTLIEFAIANKAALRSAIYGQWKNLLTYKLKHFFNHNSTTGSRRNIQAHYDLGNTFYSLWLDQTMTYSSAYWGINRHLTLSQAQSAKYQLLLDHLQAKPGDHILEIGCGWGGFAEYAALRGYEITGITISAEQFQFAKKRIKDQGLETHVDIQLLDYRKLEGRYDHVVSIEMIEAVGEKYWPIYFEKIKTLVKPGGRVAIQSIVMNDLEFNTYRKGTDFIQQYIFPGGMLPSPEILKQQVKTIQGEDVQFTHFGLDYAKTLNLWHRQFTETNAQVSVLGFNEEFLRMWKFYLGYCEGAFKSCHIDVLVMSFKV